MQKTFGREVAGVLLRMVVVIISLFLILGIIDVWYSSDSISDGWCNVAVLPVEGVIVPFNAYHEFPLVTTPQKARDFIISAENDPNIKTLLLEINSPGGTPVASEHISEAVKMTTLPTLSLIGDIGTSGGYMVAASADEVIASSMSDVGSIGVTMSYVENSEKNEEEGLTFVPLSSAEFKDAGNPNKPLTEAERQAFENDLELVHNEFVNRVAELREKPVSEVEVWADGSSMVGVEALQAGLIDDIGGRAVARGKLASRLGLDEREVVFCEYKGGVLPF